MSPEESLDPENWNEMRRLGHRMVDDAMDYLERVRERPVWQPVGDAAKAALRAPLPVKGQGPAAVYEDFLRDVFPNGMGNIHPRFWGWVIGTGTPFGALADMLASTMNPNIGGGDQGPNYVELQTLSWLREMLGYPADSSGLLVSGGSMANFVGLAVARNAKAQTDVAQEGGRFALRVCICNHRTRREDLDLLVREVLQRGRALVAEPARRS